MAGDSSDSGAYERRSDDGWMGKRFDRMLNIIQVSAIIIGGVYALAQMREQVSGLRSDLTGFEDRMDKTVTDMGRRIDSILLSGKK